MHGYPREAGERGTVSLAYVSTVSARSRGLISAWPLFCALGIAVAVRVATSNYSLWFDDLASLFYAAQLPERLWSSWMVRETTPPLYYTLLRGWCDLVGWSAGAARVPSILASLAGIGIVYFGVRRQYGAQSAAGAALLLALSPQQLFFAHQVRAYIFLFAAIAASYFGILSVMRSSTRSLAAWAIYVAGAVAGVYLHTTACLWPIAASLALILCDKRFVPFVGSRWLELAAANILVLVAASWWLAIVWLQMTILAGNIGWISPPDLTQLPLFLLRATFLDWEPSGVRLLAPALIAALATGYLAKTWKDPSSRFTFYCFVISVTAFVAVSLKQPILIDRTVLWLSVFPLTLAAAGLSDIRARTIYRTGFVFVGVLLTTATVSTIPHLEREDWRLPVRTAARQPDAVVIVDGEAMSATMQMACRAELGTDGCPFAVATLMVPGKMMDRWGDCYGANALFASQQSDAGRLKAYTFSRWAHDPLDEMHQRGLLLDVENNPLSFVGPLPASALEDMLRTFPPRDGLIWLTSKDMSREEVIRSQERACRAGE
nr:Dolichyl-phosphate-mannose-protein mannosyltransferase [uncultured organism]